MGSLHRLPNYLKTHRKRSELSQREVAALLGCRHGSKVSRYERTVRVPTLTDVFVFELVFNISARELFAGMYDDAARDVRSRAQKLAQHLDAQQERALTKRKYDYVVDIINRLYRKAA